MTHRSFHKKEKTLPPLKKQTPLHDAYFFLSEYFHKARQLGAILPSSRYLVKKMVAPVKNRPNMVVVELGAGTGVFTRALLQNLPKDATLLAFELNDHLVQYLTQTIQDSRVRIIQADAADFGRYLPALGIETVHCVVSGLPLRNFDAPERRRTLRAIEKHLDADGRYIQFQYFLSNYKEIKESFEPISLFFEWRNIPPAFVYLCKPKKLPAAEL